MATFHNMGVQQQVKIWKLENYSPSLYSWNIAECDLKNDIININLGVLYSYFV